MKPIGLASLLLLMLISGCAPEPAATPSIPSVFVTPVVNESGADQRLLFGQIRPRVETGLGFRVGGRVTERLVELGQSVRAGQALARVDPGDYQLATRAAEEQQRAAEVDAIQAARDAARFGRLLADGSLGAADAERQQAHAEAAAARLAQARKQVELARNRETYTVLTAPFDAVVTALRFEVGQMVDDTQPVLSLARQGELEVLVEIPEALVAGLRDWQASARVGDSPAGPDAGHHPLRLRELAPGANVAGRTTRARYAPTTPAGIEAWRINMTAEVSLRKTGLRAGAELPPGALLVTPSTSAPAKTAPRAADLHEAAPSVWLVDARTGVLKRQRVQVLSQTTDRVRVAGLADGALVVTVGAHKLDEGMSVRPVQRPLVLGRTAPISSVAPLVPPVAVTR